MGVVEEEKTLADVAEDAARFYHDLERQVDQLRGGYSEIVSRYDAVEAALSTATSDVDLLNQVTTLLQNLEGVWQKNFQKSVAQVISRGLTLVFEQPMELKITSRVVRDVTNVEFTIVQGEGDDAIETGLIGAKGGTVIALVNVLIRALLVLSARPALRRILILDEPFGLADDQYVPAFGELLRGLKAQLGFTIIMVSHEESMIDAADIAYEAYKTKKKGTAFRKLKDRNEVHA